MKKLVVILAAVAMAFSFASCSNGKSLKNDVDSLSYALGTDFGNSLSQIKGSMEDELNMNLFYKGVNDALAGEPKIEQQEAFAFLREYFNIKAPQKALAASQKFLDEVAARKGVEKTESGLLYQVVREGNNEKKAVNPNDEVRVVYEGKLKNGKVFDSSYERGDTVSFKLNQVIKGWAEGIQLIGEGGEIDLWIPSDLGYGQRAPQQIGANQALQFKVELIEVIPAPAEEEK